MGTVLEHTLSQRNNIYSRKTQPATYETDATVYCMSDFLGRYISTKYCIYHCIRDMLVMFCKYSICFGAVYIVLCKNKARIETEQTERGLPRLFISCSCIHNYKLTTKQNSSAPAPASYLRSNEGATFHR